MKLKQIIFIFLLFFMLINLSFAEPGIKIVEPQDGAIVHPGEEITLGIEATEGLLVTQGQVISKVISEQFTSLPVVFNIKIPIESAGKIRIGAFGCSNPNECGRAEVNLIVEQTATLQSLTFKFVPYAEMPDDISVPLDWDGNIREEKKPEQIGTIYGIYSDGITREIPEEELTYTSTDPSVISIDTKGNYQVHKVGQAHITISYLGASTVVPLTFDKPTGMRPRETIPPTTQISIQPQPNSTGWNNSDMTITLTAQDNEGGSGIREIDYSILGTDQQGLYVENNVAEINFAEQGEHELTYYACDKEGNVEKNDNSVDLKLDKTPPAITSSISPQPNAFGWNNSDVTVTFNATDKLSGVKSVTSPITVTTEGANHPVTGEAVDIADNKSSISVNLNIDKTPPKVTLTATPNILWPPDNKMVDVTIKGEATDNLSGIDTLTFKVTDEYGKVQPTLTSFGSTIKLEASRNGNDTDGRIYTISATAKDKAGNESTATAIVTVPHDQRKK